ncbi:MAG: M48 family peptidase [Limnohabitans sp.]|nr:M48 family peptidase [Limnohabitans sp.]
MSESFLMTLAFATFLVVNLAIKFWLASRQVKTVAIHRYAVPNEFNQSMSLVDHQKAADYTLAKLQLGYWDLAIDTLVLVGWTLLGGLHLLNQSLLQFIDAGMWQQIALFISFMLINGLIGLPLSLYQTFVLEEKFGFNKITWRLWTIDLVKGLLLGMVLGLPFLWVVLWLMNAGDIHWWIWTWFALIAFQLFILWIAPNFIMPLFNQFKPLEDESLKQRITQLMTQTGFSAKGFFVMDGSKRSAHSNAFFTGLGRNKRVVFYDTLLNQLSADEMQAVLAHELGHFKLKHIPKMIVINFLVSLLGLSILGFLAQQVWFYTGLGVTPNTLGPNDALALLLFMQVTPLVNFLVSPISAFRSRKHEFEADAFATQHANAQDLKTALLKLYKDNASTLTPDPLYVAFYHSHPPASQRLARLRA